jgi:hypothetical protein
MASKSKPPSLRDLSVYEEAVCTGAAQKDVACKHGVSQPRVSQIIACVGEWVATVLGDDPPATSPARAFGLALAVERLCLADECDPQAKWIKGPNDASRMLDALVTTLNHCESRQVARQEIKQVRALMEKISRLVELDAVAERTVYADLPHQMRAAARGATSTEPPYMGVSNVSNPVR